MDTRICEIRKVNNQYSVNDGTFTITYRENNILKKLSCIKTKQEVLRHVEKLIDNSESALTYRPEFYSWNTAKVNKIVPSNLK